MSTPVTEATGLAAATGTWTIDAAHTTIGFSARHAMVSKVRGAFEDFAGTITIDGADLAASSATLTIQAASINTRSADRDGHLRSADFLDVDAYPTIDYVSTGVRVDGERVVVTGDLTIHGVTKPIDVVWEFTGMATDPWGNTKIGFEGSATFSRKEFGLVWNAALETGGVLVSDEVKLSFDVEAGRQS